MKMKFEHITCKFRPRHCMIIDTSFANAEDEKAMEGKNHLLAVGVIKGHMEAWCKANDIRHRVDIDESDCNMRVSFGTNEDLVAFRIGFIEDE